MISLIQQHYDALKTGKPRAHRCTSCKHLTFPITTVCEQCGRARRSGDDGEDGGDLERTLGV